MHHQPTRVEVRWRLQQTTAARAGVKSGPNTEAKLTARKPYKRPDIFYLRGATTMDQLVTAYTRYGLVPLQ